MFSLRNIGASGRFEQHLAGHGLQNAASPKLVDGRKAGDNRDRRMSEGHMKHGLGERRVHLGAELLRENFPGSCIMSTQLPYPSILWTKAIQVQAGLTEMDEVAISAGQNKLEVHILPMQVTQNLSQEKSVSKNCIHDASYNGK